MCRAFLCSSSPPYFNIGCPQPPRRQVHVVSPRVLPNLVDLRLVTQSFGIKTPLSRSQTPQLAMSSSGRYTRSRNVRPTDPALPSEPTSNPPPSVAAQRSALLTEYHTTYDEGNGYRLRVPDALSTDAVTRLLNGLDISLHRLEDIVTRMESVPSGNWGFARPNISHWPESLGRLRKSAAVDRLFGRIQSLAGRISAVAGRNHLLNPHDFENGVVDLEAGEAVDFEDGVVGSYELEEPVRVMFYPPFIAPHSRLQCDRCREMKKPCEYLEDQEAGTRCLACVRGKRGPCSLVEKKKRKPKTTPVRPTRSQVVPEGEEDVGEELEITPPKTKGKGLFEAISGKLTGKRKQDDRSPEQVSSSKPASSRFSMVCVLVPLAPRPLSDYQKMELPIASASSSEPTSMGPPPTDSAPPTSPSFSSFETHESRSGRNFEAERYSMLLRASQEDLRAMRQGDAEDFQELSRRYRDKERRMLESFAKERAIYETEIESLRRQLEDVKRRDQDRSGGGGGSRRG